MRVVQAIAGGRQGGAEAFFVRLVTALDRAGLTQLVATRRGRPWVETLRRSGVTPVELPFGGAFDLCSRRALRREIDRFRPDLVVSWMSRATRYCSRRHRGYAHVARLGGYYKLDAYRSCDHLIGNTPDLVAYLVGQGWPADRAHYLPNFVDDRAMPPVDRATLDTPSGVPIVLALGRLHPNKAFDVLIRAMAEIPGAILWLAGEGALGSELERLAARLMVADRVRFLGWRDDVPALLAAADMLVCPSRHEPLGNVVIEAWARRKPVVAAAGAGPAALIEDGASGLLVPIDDAEVLAGAMRRVLDDPGLAAHIGAGGRAAYEAGFTEQAVVGRYLAFFDQVAS